MSTNPTNADASTNGLTDGARNGLCNGEIILNKYENDETRSLTTEQLQRYVFLKQVKLINCQQQRLDRLDGENKILKDVVFDYVGFDDENAL